MNQSKTFLLINQAVADNCERFLWECKLDGSWEVVFQPKKETRKLNQNAALWAVAYPPVMEEMGLRGEKEREEIHEYFCGEYWGWKTYSILGKKKSKPVRTTTRNDQGKKDIISKSEMYDFYNFIHFMRSNKEFL